MILLDSHVHVYPFYDLSRFFAAVTNNFNCLEKMHGLSSSERVLCLTERFDCDFFSETRRNAGEQLQNVGISYRPVEESSCVLEFPAGERCYVIAGHQIVTKQRLEVLALGMCEKLEDGLDINFVLDRVRQAGALPVLNWSPGKWLFERGKVIESIIRSAKSDDFCVGDIPLRPLGWGMPRLLTLATGKGIRLLAGSDPLPYRGEESTVASYASAFPRNDLKESPWNALRALLQDSSTPPKVLGKRNSPYVAATRYIRNEVARRTQ